MAVVVLLLLDAFMMSAVREGLRSTEFGLTDSLSYDWPILLAHVILFACLLAMSAVDLEHYWVDIRFTNFVTVAGFVLHTLWTPLHSIPKATASTIGWPRPLDETAVACVFALLGLAVVWILLTAQQPFLEPPDDAAIDVDVDDSDKQASDRSRRPPPSLMSPSRLAGWIGAGLLLILVVALFVRDVTDIPIRHAALAAMPLLFFFILIVSESTVARASDQAIVEAIHEERHGARTMVLTEFLLLLPALFLGIFGLLLMLKSGDFAARAASILHVSTSVPQFDFLRYWEPVYGFSTAASGFVIAGAMGWAIRIFFTVAFGKEAFGTGDIHLMAAAGCVAGWQVVAVGFFLTCGISLVGWLATLPFKKTRALPLGPWLSLAFLIVVIFYHPIVQWGPIRNAVTVARWLFLENSQDAFREAMP